MAATPVTNAEVEAAFSRGSGGLDPTLLSDAISVVLIGAALLYLAHTGLKVAKSYKEDPENITSHIAPLLGAALILCLLLVFVRS